jgi:hypothetical protein
MCIQTRLATGSDSRLASEAQLLLVCSNCILQFYFPIQSPFQLSSKIGCIFDAMVRCVSTIYQTIDQ